MRRGLLFTLTEPPPAMAEEFNAWYDAEHIPERLSIPGFRSARRWVSGGTYLATYELDSAAVLASTAYLKYYENPTPWSRRCMGKLLSFRRWACEQVEPGDADPHPRPAGLIFSAQEIDPPGVLQRRRFLAGDEQLLLYELSEVTAGAYRLYQP